MSLDATKPTDQELVSALPYYIRLHASTINSLIAGITDFTISDLILLSGTTSLVVGNDLSDVAFEIVLIETAGVSNIAQIRGGTSGQIKLFIFQDNSVTFTDGVKSLGALYLNQLPVGSSLVAQQDDVLALINIGGDGASEYGYWKELWRQISVK